MPALALSLGLPFRSTGGGGGTVGPPSDPTGFTATAQESEIDLAWDVQPEADNFDVYYGLTNDQGSSTILLTGYVGTSYTFGASDSIQPGEKYYFWIQATNGAGTSGYAGSVTARSYVTVAHGGSALLTTPTGTWTIGTILFSSTIPAPLGITILVGAEGYGSDGSGGWEDLNTSDPSSGVAISGAFTVSNGSGGSYTFWNTEP